MPTQTNELFSEAQIDKLRHEYANILAIDPEQPTYTNLTNKLDTMPQALLQQLAGASIKWVSMLARNRIKKV